VDAISFCQHNDDKIRFGVVHIFCNIYIIGISHFLRGYESPGMEDDDDNDDDDGRVMGFLLPFCFAFFLF
jgi:hypothetical protein